MDILYINSSIKSMDIISSYILQHFNEYHLPLEKLNPLIINFYRDLNIKAHPIKDLIKYLTPGTEYNIISLNNIMINDNLRTIFTVNENYIKIYSLFNISRIFKDNDITLDSITCGIQKKYNIRILYNN